MALKALPKALSPKSSYGGPTSVAPVKNVPKPVGAPRISTAAATKAYYGDNPYGSLGVSPGTAAKIDAMPVAAGGLAVTAPKAPAVSTPGYWNTPDYSAMLAGDWEPGEAAIQGQKQRADAEAAFQQNLRRAFIDYGGDASKLDDKFRPYIDDATIEAAKNNKFSAMAQNLAASTKSLRQQRAALAARGMSASGANTLMTKQALQAREQADYGSGRDFLSGAETGLGGLSTVDHQIAQMITDAKSRAAARIAQENPQTWVPGTGPDYEGEAAYGTTPKAPAAWGGVSWGGNTGITTKAGLKAALGYNQNINDWARQHPDAWAKMT